MIDRELELQKHPFNEQGLRGPSPAEVMEWIAKAAPLAWFPARHDSSTPRELVDLSLDLLRRMQLVHAMDWELGVGQGYKLTSLGLEYRNAKLETKPAAVVSAVEPNPEASSLPALANDESLPPSRVPPAIVTPAIIIVLIIWFSVGFVLAWRHGVGLEFIKGDLVKGDPHPGVTMALMKTGAVRGTALLQGDWWRLFVCCFVHLGVIHLLGHIILIALLGPLTENLWGRWRFLLIYLLAGCGGAAITMAIEPFRRNPSGESPEIVLVGASGSLCGMVGALITWWYPKRQFRRSDKDDNQGYGRFLLISLGVIVALGFSPQGNIFAHFGGYLSGILATLILDRIDVTRPRTIRVGILRLVFAIMMIGFGLFSSMRWSERWKDVRSRSDIVRLSYERDRAKLTCGDVYPRVQRSAVFDLFDAIKHTLVAPTPKAVERSRQRLKQLHIDAVIAQERCRSLAGEDFEEFRRYLQAVVRFTEEADSALTRNSHDLTEVVKSLQIVDESWNHLSWQQNNQ